MIGLHGHSSAREQVRHRLTVRVKWARAQTHLHLEDTPKICLRPPIVFCWVLAFGCQLLERLARFMTYDRGEGASPGVGTSMHDVPGVWHKHSGNGLSRGLQVTVNITRITRVWLQV